MPSDWAKQKTVELRRRYADQRARVGLADPTGADLDELIAEALDEARGGKTITAAELADQLWDTVVENDMFDERLRPVEAALRDVCKRLVGYAVTAVPE